MPRKKKEAVAEKKVRPLSQMELEIKRTQQENEMLADANKKREKLLTEMEEIKMRERLALGEEAPEGGDSEPEPDDVPMQSRHRFMTERGVAREQSEQIQRAEDFEKTLEGFQATAGKVHVYRLKDGNYSKMGVIEAKDWSDGVEGVAKRFGGGTFKIRLHAPDGTFAGETITHYDEDAYPKPSANQPQQVPVVVQPPDQSNMFKVIMDLQEKSNERQMMMMKEMFSAMSSMNAPRSSMVNNMNDLMAFKEMMTEKKNPASELSTLVGVLQKGMELGQSAQPAEGGFLDGLLSKLVNGDTLGKVATALAAATTAPEGPVGPVGPPPAPGPGAAPAPRAQLPAPAPKPQAPRQQKQEDGKMNLVVSMYKPIILGYAKNKVPPKKVADMVIARIASINEGWLLIVHDFLQMPTTKDKFVYAYAPELKPVDAWVTAVMKSMSDSIADMMKRAGVEDTSAEPRKAAAKKASPAPAPAEPELKPEKEIPAP